MGLMENLSRTLSSAVGGFNSQATSQKKVSASDLSASLVALGEQLTSSGTKSEADSSSTEAMAGSLSQNPVFIMRDVQSKFHDGDFSALV